jgi:hypothetical protein
MDQATVDFVTTQRKIYLSLTPEQIKGYLDNLNDPDTPYDELEITYPMGEYTADLAKFPVELLHYKFPLGIVGDLVYVPEPYRILRICKNLDGYLATVLYQDLDNTTLQIQVDQQYPLTPTGTWMTNVDPTEDAFVRLKLILSEIVRVNEGDTDWTMYMSSYAFNAAEFEK